MAGIFLAAGNSRICRELPEWSCVEAAATKINEMVSECSLEQSKTVEYLLWNSPMFVYPVPNKDDPSQFYTLYGEWNKEDSQCRMAFLEDFRKDPAAAQAYFHLYPHLEFFPERDTVLLQAEYLPYLSKQVTLMNIYQTRVYQSSIRLISKPRTC